MTTYKYFVLKNSEIGGRNFVAAFPDAKIIGMSLSKNVTQSITGAINVSIAPTAQRIHLFNVLINGDEQETFDPDHNMQYAWGNYEDLISYFNSVDAEMTDWFGQSYNVVFINSQLQPIFLSPQKYPMLVQIELLEKTEGAS